MKMRTPIFLVLIVLLATTLACSIDVDTPNIDLPDIQIQSTRTRETKTFTIDEPAPGGEPATLKIGMGGGTLNISGGASGWVQGTVDYNVDKWAPVVNRDGNSLELKQGEKMLSIPTGSIVNDWNLRLGNYPMELDLSLGAYKGEIDLSGVPITKLAIADGASTTKVLFHAPNSETMSLFTYKTGASNVELIGLANAGFENMTFDGGAGSFTLDFSGQLQHDADVQITSGVSEVEIIVPTGVASRVTIGGGLNDVSPRGTWTVTDNVYSTTGEGPLLDIQVDMGVGSLKLTQK